MADTGEWLRVVRAYCRRTGEDSRDVYVSLLVSIAGSHPGLVEAEVAKFLAMKGAGHG